LTDRYPEVEIARLIQKRHDFAPGSNLLELVKQYAEVDYLPIPVDKVDGVSLHLKVNGRRPSIIVNSHIPDTRAKFTLAHEFGHVVIPWHIGTIFSFTDSEKHTEGADMAYWEMEAEANRFAAELLMPKQWLNSLVIEHQDPTVVAKLALDLCGTSMAAITIALNNALPAGYLYARTEADGIVSYSMCSPGTFIKPFNQGDQIEGSSRMDECSAWYVLEFKGSHHWMYFNTETPLELITDEREWRLIFDEIIADTGAEALQANIKHSVNAIISSANKKENTAEAFLAAVRYKMAGRDDVYERILAHPLFNVFVQKKIAEFIQRRN
jgi:Zn-dependent peptidase ImmA (M78 family)